MKKYITELLGLVILVSTTGISAASENNYAVVTEVRTQGGQSNYDFTVTVKSPDKGCRQYANWWEVLTIDGKLLYRRILAHSHVTEQPFTRSGGTVNINPDTEVIVRAHMHPAGYGPDAMRGSVAKGFAPVALTKGFAARLERLKPHVEYCAW